MRQQYVTMMFSAEDSLENLTDTVAQIGLSDVELTAITMLEKEVGLLSNTANEKKCCLCAAVWCQGLGGAAYPRMGTYTCQS